MDNAWGLINILNEIKNVARQYFRLANAQRLIINYPLFN